MSPLEVIGLLLIVCGVILILVALLLPRRRFGDYSVGGIILVGPIPIIFGKNIKTSLLIVLIVVSLMMMLFMAVLMGAWK